MSFSRSDLTPLLTPPPDEPVRFGQGKILSWDRETFENQIEFRGVTITDVPVMSGIEALTYEVGDIVSLIGWAPDGGFGSWWINGRIVIPGSGKGASAVKYLEESIDSDIVTAEESLNEDAGDDSGYTNLSTTGPSVTFETVTGRWIVIFFANGSIPGDKAAARMSYEVSGAQSFSADNSRSTVVGIDVASTNAGFGNHVYARTHNGSSGEITVTAKYRLIAATSFPSAASWSNRFLMIISY